MLQVVKPAASLHHQTNKNKQNKMKKIIIAATAILGFTSASFAQSNASGTASQTVQLALSNALEITFNYRIMVNILNPEPC